MRVNSEHAGHAAPPTIAKSPTGIDFLSALAQRRRDSAASLRGVGRVRRGFRFRAPIRLQTLVVEAPRESPPAPVESAA